MFCYYANTFSDVLFIYLHVYLMYVCVLALISMQYYEGPCGVSFVSILAHIGRLSVC